MMSVPNADQANLPDRATTEGPLVAVLVAVHNRLALTQRCLQSLKGAVSRARLLIVLVDDGSTDGTAEWVAGYMPEAIVLHGDGQLWFGGSVQAGLDYILQLKPPASHVLTVNNDSFMRLGSIDEMLAASEGDSVVAAAYWTEDLAQPNTAGFRWSPDGNLNDVCYHTDWQTAHAAGSQRFLPVGAVATTACLYPTPLLARAARVNLRRHRQNRYDAVLSANLRAAGARFLVSTHFLADHLYGPLANRPPRLRSVSLGEFFRLTLLDPLSVYHVAHTINALWITAPSRRMAVRLIVRCFLRFLGQVGAKLLQTVLASTGIRLWNSDANREP
jgi:N-acetylglucosaminyl-diphospho-decaprenol L-rhamnosyltransferase